MLKTAYLVCGLSIVALSSLVACSGDDDAAGVSGGKDGGSAGNKDSGQGAKDSGAPHEARCESSPNAIIQTTDEVPDGASALTAPAIAVDSTHLYFIVLWQGTSTIQGELKRKALDGGKTEHLASLATGTPASAQALALTKESAIFIQLPGNDGKGGAIASVPLEGGDPTVLAKTSGPASAVVANDKNAYFADEDGTKSVPLKGGKVQMLSSSVPYSLGLVGDSLYMAELDKKVSSISTEGGEATTVSDEGGLYPIACGSNTCWIGGAALNESLVQLTPGQKPTSIAQGLREVHDVVFDRTNFFIATSRGSLVRVPARGGTPIEAYIEIGLSNLAVDASCLYWSSARTITGVLLKSADIAKAN